MSNYTKLPGVPDIDDAVPGMAHFAGTGPTGYTCGGCAHRGYWRQSSQERWSNERNAFETHSYRHMGCAMFKVLTGHYGPQINSSNKCCKYFEPKLGE